MPRVKGSKNKVKAVAKKPAVVKKAKVVKPVKAVKVKAAGDDLGTQVRTFLSHILDLFKASLIDAFRQYIESQIKGGRVPSAEQFMEIHKHSVARHGITKDELLGALSDVELETVTNATAKEIVNDIPVEPAKKAHSAAIIKGGSQAPETDLTGADPLDPIANKEPAKAETNNKSVFDGLDLI